MGKWTQPHAASQKVHFRKERIWRLRVCSVSQSCPALCNPTDCSPPGSFVHGIPQARILEWVAISSSGRSSQPRDGTRVSCLAVGFFTTEPPGKPIWSLGIWILILYFLFYFIFKLYIIVLVLPNIKMNPPQVSERMSTHTCKLFKSEIVFAKENV